MSQLATPSFPPAEDSVLQRDSHDVAVTNGNVIDERLDRESWDGLEQE